MPYPDDPALERELLDLFASCWPRVPRAIERARLLGGDWRALSWPFVSRDADGRAAGHAGVLVQDLIVGGRRRRLAGVHGVCVHPRARGRGHMRRSLEQALAFVDDRFEDAVLWTEEPALYERFGFAVRRESIALVELEPARARARAEPWPALGGRALALDASGDREGLRALLREREPLSERAASVEPGGLALVDLALTPGGEQLLRAFDALECVAALERAGERLIVHDLWARRVPALEDFLERAAPDARTLELRVEIDRWLERDHRRLPHASEDLLMVRGEGLARSLDALGSFCLSPFARC